MAIMQDKMVIFADKQKAKTKKDEFQRCNLVYFCRISTPTINDDKWDEDGEEDDDEKDDDGDHEADAEASVAVDVEPAARVGDALLELRLRLPTLSARQEWGHGGITISSRMTKDKTFFVQDRWNEMTSTRTQTTQSLNNCLGHFWFNTKITQTPVSLGFWSSLKWPDITTWAFWSDLKWLGTP